MPQVRVLREGSFARADIIAGPEHFSEEATSLVFLIELRQHC
jgi:hypothetical protein